MIAIKQGIKRFVASILALSLSLSWVVYASQEDALSSVNSASADTIAAAVEDYLTEAGKEKLYTSLPECDQEGIQTRILNGVPYADYNELENAYQSALEATTRVDTETYNQVFVEDFNGGADASWTAVNVADNAIGTGKILGKERQSLAITDEEYSFAVFGGSLQTKKANYIEREIENPQSVVTLYMRVMNNNALSFSATFDGSNGIGLKNTGADCHTIVNNDAKDKTGVAFSTTKWNKIVFDGTESGKVKCYVNGSLAASFNSTMTKLTVGTIFNFGSYSILEIDNISIGEAKPESDFMDRFNNSQVTEESLAGVLGGTAGGVFQKLPECDRTELVKIIEAGKPYTDKTAIRNQYDKALIKVTQYDSDKYGLYFSEDFGNGITSDWESAKNLQSAAF